MEIENLLQANRKSLRDFPSMPYPLGYAANPHQNNLIYNELAYDRDILAAEFDKCYQSLTAIDNVSKSVSNHGRMLNPNGENYVARVLARVESTELQGLNKPLLQSLSLPIFYDNLAPGKVASTPDPGSAILLSVEVLVTVSRKHTLFPMDVWHVGHLLHIPVALFQNFYQLKVSKGSGPSETMMISDEHICDQIKRVDFCHEKVLDDESIMNKVCFSSEEGVACASSLRRIYEEANTPHTLVLFTNFMGSSTIDLNLELVESDSTAKTHEVVTAKTL
ncbi:hypothetical protein JHK82_039554 [Glycine max]|nr:hypothetical protein JHK86_039742 [Glycine max]KAG5110331.1 hypothetical protein JHK82_039554 [Glycine max]